MAHPIEDLAGPIVSLYGQPALKLAANDTDVCTISDTDIEPRKL